MQNLVYPRIICGKKFVIQEGIRYLSDELLNFNEVKLPLIEIF